MSISVDVVNGDATNEIILRQYLHSLFFSRILTLMTTSLRSLFRANTIRASINEERQIHRETISEFLARGGKITRCVPKRATQTLEGATVIDGMTISVITGGAEAVPQFTRATVEHYDKGMKEAIQPYHHLAWRDIERESVSADVRHAMEYVSADADEIDYTESPTW